MSVELTDQVWRALLQELCQRDGAVELAPASHETVTFRRARLLECRLGDAIPYLIVERPAHPDSVRDYRRGATVQVLVMRPPHRFGFESAVIEPLKYGLNQRVALLALKLSAPHQVQPVQRRRFFRADTAGADFAPAVFMPVQEKTEKESNDQAAPPVKTWSASICNLSGGGLAVVMPKKAARQLKIGQSFCCRLSLPIESPLEITVKLVYQRFPKDDVCYLGFQITEPDDQVRRQCENAICRYITTIQRQQLQRRRD